MQTKFLFPFKLKKIGWVFICIAALLITFFTVFSENTFLTNVPVFYVYKSNNPFDQVTLEKRMFSTTYDDVRFEVITTLFVLGCLLIGFSKLRTEDEFTMKLRLESLLWAMYINFSIFLFSVLFIYGFDFVMIPFYSLLAFLAIFILRFHYVLYRAKKISAYEK